MQSGIKHVLLTTTVIFSAGASSIQGCNLAKKIATAGAVRLLPNSLSDPDKAPPHDPSAVGLWQSTFNGEDGSVFVGFETIYADGNELLIDNSAPATDNVCSGVWEQTGPRTYVINHPSWDFEASGDLIGIVVLSDTITVDAKGNKYMGSAIVTVYDPTLTNIVYQVSGSLTGIRITVKSTPL